MNKCNSCGSEWEAVKCPQCHELAMAREGGGDDMSDDLKLAERVVDLECWRRGIDRDMPRRLDQLECSFAALEHLVETRLDAFHKRVEKLEMSFSTYALASGRHHLRLGALEAAMAIPTGTGTEDKPQDTGDIGWALRQLAAGKKARCPFWTPGSYAQISSVGMAVIHMSNGTVEPLQTGRATISATWELVP